MAAQRFHWEQGRGAGIGFFIALAALTALVAGCPASPAQAIPPQQVVVFDGSPAAADTFLVSLSSSGLGVDAGEGGFECAGVTHVSSGGVLPLGPQQTGVFPSLFGFGAASQIALLTQPYLAAAAVEAFADDCDVLDNFSLAHAYLAQARSDADGSTDSVESCVSQVEQEYCDLLAAVEGAAIVPPDPNDSGITVTIGCTDPEYTGANPIGAPFCNLFAWELSDGVPHRIDEITRHLAECQEIRLNLAATSSAVGGELSQQEHDDLLAAADAALAAAHSALGAAELELSAIYSLQAEMSLEAVQSSCSSCGPSEDPPLQLLPSVALSLQAERGPLAALVTAFQDAARGADDPNDAARFLAIASHMSSIPASRVHHVTYPSGSQVGSHTVALRSQSWPDDYISPLAVIVTAEVGRAWASEMNPMDRHIVTESWRAFVRALDPNALLPDDEDDDDDGLRDIYENETGEFKSRLDAGTHPDRPDSDGDLFWDATEAVTGGNPNDPNSLPQTAPLSAIPTLAPWAVALLLLLVAVAGLQRRASHR